jgi:NADPH-dependent 2,4-dienoyl-CoA reductase/sulfur reductase-like enzyme
MRLFFFLVVFLAFAFQDGGAFQQHSGNSKSKIRSNLLAEAVAASTPSRIDKTQNFRDAEAMSSSFLPGGALHAPAVDQTKKKTVAIIGGGLSGLACAKYLADAGW